MRRRGIFAAQQTELLRQENAFVADDARFPQSAECPTVPTLYSVNDSDTPAVPDGTVSRSVYGVAKSIGATLIDYASEKGLRWSEM